MKKVLALTTLCTLSLAQAATFSLTQLAQLIKSPDKFKPSAAYTDSKVNASFLVHEWQWGKGLLPDTGLLRSPHNPMAWQLNLLDAGYTLAEVAPQRRLLAVVDDSPMNTKLNIYAITGGSLQGAYVLEFRSEDDSGSIKVQSEAFALVAARSSGYQEDTSTKLLSYPLYGVLSAKAAMCGLPEVTCK